MLRALALASAGAVVIGLVAGAIVSKHYWGYSFARPPLPRAVVAAARVVGIAELRPESSGDRCSMTSAAISAAAMSERIRIARPYVDELPGMRMTVALADRGLNPESAPYAATVRGAEVYAQLLDGGLISRGDPGYGGCVGGFGLVVDTSGGQRLLVEVTGPEVSNDHHPWSEAVFSYSEGHWRLVDGELLFYDVAGMEGADWPRLHVLFAILALPLTSVAAFAVLWRREARSRRAA